MVQLRQLHVRYQTLIKKTCYDAFLNIVNESSDEIITKRVIFKEAMHEQVLNMYDNDNLNMLDFLIEVSKKIIWFLTKLFVVFENGLKNMLFINSALLYAFFAVAFP